METFDLIVVGAGPGGYAAATRAAQKGLKTALVERAHVGGCCLNRGCVPTKSIMHAARLYREIRGAARFGLTVQGVCFDIDEIYANKNKTVETLRGGVEQLLKANRVALYSGRAAVTGPGRVLVRGGETTELAGKNILLATGGKPAPLPPHLRGVDRVYTSDDILAEKAMFFERLVIVGGGVIGMEFASLYSDLGVEVSVVELQSNILPKADRETRQNLSMIMKRRGVRIEVSTALTGIEESREGLVCTFEKKGEPFTISCNAVLVATGRQANTDGLFEGFQGAKCEKGALVVDDCFRTTVPGIYAIGDCTANSIQLAHMATAQAINAISHMVGEKAPIDLKTVPACVYTDPEIASVGMSAEEAKATGIDTFSGKYVMTGNGKSMLSGQERGFIKLLFNSADRRIIGAQLMCARATDIVGELSAAISGGLTREQIAGAVHPHPTYAEGVWEAAEDAERLSIHNSPRVKR